jgi:hypothetical protein
LKEIGEIMNSSPWLDLIKYSWPILIAYAAVAVVGLVMLPRHRTPAILSLIGAALLLGAMMIPTAYRTRQITNSYSLEKARMVYLLVDVIRAGGIALLIVATYIGRQPNAGQPHVHGFTPGGVAGPQYGAMPPGGMYGAPPYGAPPQGMSPYPGNPPQPPGGGFHPHPPQ